MRAVENFLEALRRGPRDCTGVFNPWRDYDARDAAPRREAPVRRRANMSAYLEARVTKARALLLGEAPSHRGCRFTGIAFCSEVELRNKPSLVAERALAMTSAHAATKPVGERSAAIIWDELERSGCARQVVLWNAFPWHPYRAESARARAAGPCGPASNRRPRNAEVDEGRPVLDALLACFTHPLEIYAVGKVAEEALVRWGEREYAGYIRHPAQGGESRFRAQFRREVVARL